MPTLLQSHLLKYLISTLLLCSVATAKGQRYVHQFLYKPTASAIIDPGFSLEDLDSAEVVSAVAGFDSIIVYITPRYFASMAYNSAGWMHTSYNRKTRIIRMHLNYGNTDSYTEDSVMYYLNKDSQLRKKAGRIKDTLEIREYPRIQRKIHGRKCHLITCPTYGWLSSQVDSIWVTRLKGIPNFLEPGFYYLLDGLPLEYVVNNGVVSVQVTSGRRRVTEIPHKLLTIDPGSAELRQLQTQKRIADVVRYIEEFKARLN